MAIKYNLASSSWDNSEIDAMQKVIDSGFFTMGENVKKFETNLSKKFGSKKASVLSSGTAGLHLCGKALGWKKNDIILMPAINFIASYNMAKTMGLKVYQVCRLPQTSFGFHIFCQNVSPRWLHLVSIIQRGLPDKSVYQLHSLVPNRHVN